MGRRYGERKLLKMIKKRDAEIARLRKELHLDFGTGVLSKKQGFTRLKSLMVRCHKENKAISIAFVDVDKLKDINDNFGHCEGDRLLNRIATLIKNNIRKEDFVYRYGGDEFIIVFADADINEAKEIWSRVKKTLYEENNKGKLSYKISLSAGFAECNGNINIQDLVEYADKDMYRNKRMNYQE